MTLETYLDEKKLSPTEFAGRCGVPPSTITRLLARERSPGFSLLVKIYDVTGGLVSPNDFLATHAARPGALAQDGAAA
jgi:predicted transcriptional regulator